MRLSPSKIVSALTLSAAALVVAAAPASAEPVSQEQFSAALTPALTAFAANAHGKTQITTMTSPLFGSAPATVAVNPDGSLTSNFMGTIKCVTKNKCWTFTDKKWHALPKGSVVLQQSDTSSVSDAFTIPEGTTATYDVNGNTYTITATDAQGTTVMVLTVDGNTISETVTMTADGQPTQTLLTGTITYQDAPVVVKAPPASKIGAPSTVKQKMTLTVL